MASNSIPRALPSLLLFITKAHMGAESHGTGLLVINTAARIGVDRQALFLAQDEYQTSRAALVGLSTARKQAAAEAWEFCFTVRDVLTFYFGRYYGQQWLAAGWENSLAIPQQFEGLYALVNRLSSFFNANPAKENAALGVTAAHAQAVAVALQSADAAYLDGEVASLTLRNVRDAKVSAARKRLSNLAKELSMELGDLDPRWLWFGFNMPGAPTTPAAPEAVTVFPQADARVQIACDPSPGATSYRFYVQRPVIDPAPVPVGSSTEPLFITDPLVAGVEYLIYVSASNEGAESGLSEPVPVVTSASVAA